MATNNERERRRQDIRAKMSKFDDRAFLAQLADEEWQEIEREMKEEDRLVELQTLVSRFDGQAFLGQISPEDWRKLEEE